MLTEERKSQVIALCQKMIKTRSYSGEEQGVVANMKEYGEKAGFDRVYTDRLGNCICVIKGNRPGRKIVFDAHMDTVPVPEQDLPSWHHDPFGAEIDGDRLYGRGTTDMKGALSAMLTGADFFLQDYGRDFSGEIYIAGIVHEECFEGVAAREITAQIDPDIIIIGEASDLNVKIGQRGRAEILVETFGIPAHSSNPEKGVNAVYSMMKLAERIRKLPAPKHPFLKDGILELTDIKSLPYPGKSVVPDRCLATYDRRLLDGETKESVLKPIREIIEELTASDPDFKASVSYAHGNEVCYTGEPIEDDRFFPGWCYAPEEDYIQKVYQKLLEKGYTPELTKYDFCTNGSHYAGEAGIKTLGIGPSNETIAHTIDEYVELSQLTGAAECYYAVMEALLR